MGFMGSSGTPAMWESSRLKRGGAGAGTGYPSFSTKSQGFFGRHMRRLSSSLPRFNTNPYYAEKEKLNRGRWPLQSVPLLGRIRSILARMSRRTKMRLLILFLILLSIYIFYNSRELLLVPCDPWESGRPSLVADTRGQRWYTTGGEQRGLGVGRSL